MSTTSTEIMMKQCGNYMQSMEKKKLVVLLENCLQDVPRIKDKNHGCSSCQGLSSNTTRNELLEIDCISACQSRNVSVSDPGLPDSEEEIADCSNQTGPAPAQQKLSVAKSLFLELPITSTIEDDMAKSSIIGDNSALYGRGLGEPVECEVKTPVTSKNSSRVDLDLTPPSSIASGRGLIEDSESTSLEEELDNNIDNKIFTDKNKCKELCLQLVLIEPTIKQLQSLYSRNDHHKQFSLSSRPKRDRKQFIPFMFEQAKYMKKRKPRSSSLFHSSPKVNDTSSEKIREKTSNTNLQLNRKYEEKQIKIDRKRKKAIKMKQLRLALRQKEASEKQQLRLALKQKKEALKWRNKFENALASINRRIYHQNAFWKMLPS